MKIWNGSAASLFYIDTLIGYRIVFNLQKLFVL